MGGFALNHGSDVRLYRLYADGFVGPYPAPFVWMPRVQAVKLARQTIMAPGQIGWGTAWGYPESAVEPLPRWYDARTLCLRWNTATAPYVPRTDHEHHRNAQLARAIRERLSRLGVRVKETESGRIWPA